ncbi:hypothetical protein BDV26DRAFT_295269 [Aspergillus bertholletiae]|uniref:Uncharacterized protein n=1 Tax=Aspergillus bertholletiae TaxID=1226010 RepID=A0A5N7B1E9_9EURO|nr:hypothetical protein BDV26DRAFT_295269 [Aspergillus bertholletiae]
MHWVNILSLLALAHAPVTSALSAARIWASFSPHCLANDHTSYPDDPNLGLHEEFITAVDVVAGKCQEVPVPLRFAREVDHVSIDADIFWQDNLDQCDIAVYELPGCAATPLIQTDIRYGKALSECEERSFAVYTQIWVRLECEKMKPIPHGITSWHHGEHGNNTGTADDTGEQNGTSPYSRTGVGKEISENHQA